MGKMVGNEPAKRNVSVIVATVFFAIFGILAIIIGVVDILDPPFPYAQRLPIIGHVALIVGILSLVATGLLWIETSRGIFGRCFIRNCLCG